MLRASCGARTGYRYLEPSQYATEGLKQEDVKTLIGRGLGCVYVYIHIIYISI